MGMLRGASVAEDLSGKDNGMSGKRASNEIYLTAEGDKLYSL